MYSKAIDANSNTNGIKKIIIAKMIPVNSNRIQHFIFNNVRSMEQCMFLKQLNAIVINESFQRMKLNFSSFSSISNLFCLLLPAQ